MTDGCPYSPSPQAPATAEEIVASSGVKSEYTNEMVYGDYLHLDPILQAQHTLSPDHNEMLFIIQHQTSELWMKLILHEVSAARTCVQADQLGPAFKMLARASRVFEQLVSAWNVLSTLTPSEYHTIRPYLGESSGFQSWQYRQIEFLLGNKNPAMVRPHAHQPARMAAVQAALEEPSLYDESLRLLSRHGFAIPAELVDRDWTRPYTSHPAVVEAWKQVYLNPEEHWQFYQLAEKLVDMEDMFRQWRFRHVTTVERVIGFKKGTGGSSGIGYLRAMLDVILFPELWEARTLM